jgi:hypothetical protein
VEQRYALIEKNLSVLRALKLTGGKRIAGKTAKPTNLKKR